MIEYNLISILELEQVSISEIRRFALQAKNFAYQINDSDQMLRLKYLYCHPEKEFSRPDLLFMKDFDQFSNYYIKTNQQLEQQLVEEGIYLQEERHAVLVALSGIVFENSKAALDYLSSSRELFLSEMFLALFGWSGLTSTWARKLYEKYPGPRSEEILLTLEGLGFEELLLPPFPLEILLCVLGQATEKRSHNALRSTCQVLSKQPDYVPIVKENIPLSALPETISSPLSIYRPKPPIKVVVPKTTEQICCVKSNVILAIQSANFDVLQEENKAITCQARFDRLFTYILEYGHTEVLLFLLEMFIDSIPSSTWIDDSQAAVRRGKLKMVQKLKAILQHYDKRLEQNLYAACLDLLNV